MNQPFYIPPSTLSRKRYAVKRTGTGQFLGVVTANNLSHAHTKALQLFRRHVYVERLT
jgi:hypothetical protein